MQGSDLVEQQPRADRQASGPSAGSRRIRVLYGPNSELMANHAPNLKCKPNANQMQTKCKLILFYPNLVQTLSKLSTATRPTTHLIDGQYCGDQAERHTVHKTLIALIPTSAIFLIKQWQEETTTTGNRSRGGLLSRVASAERIHTLLIVCLVGILVDLVCRWFTIAKPRKTWQTN